MDSDKVAVQRTGHVLLIGLNRPDRRNFFDLQTMSGFADAYGQLNRDPQLRAGLLFGHGPDFCACLELASVSEHARSARSGTR